MGPMDLITIIPIGDISQVASQHAAALCTRMLANRPGVKSPLASEKWGKHRGKHIKKPLISGKCEGTNADIHVSF